MKRSYRNNAAPSVVLAGALIAFMVACDGGREGERCNPSLSHDDCNTGLTCQQPSTCAENYCCPDPATSSTSPYCNGSGCPPLADAGGDGGTDAGQRDAGAATDAGTQ